MITERDRTNSHKGKLKQVSCILFVVPEYGCAWTLRYLCMYMYLLLPVMLVVHVHRVIVCSFTCLHTSYTQCASIIHNSCTIHIVCLHCMCWCVLCSGIHWSLPSSGETSTPWHSSWSGLHRHSWQQAIWCVALTVVLWCSLAPALCFDTNRSNEEAYAIACTHTHVQF